MRTNKKKQRPQYIDVKECIDILSSKPDRRDVNLTPPKISEVIYTLYPTIQELREKGYTLGEICDMLSNDCGVDININTFKNYVYRASKRHNVCSEERDD